MLETHSHKWNRRRCSTAYNLGTGKQKKPDPVSDRVMIFSAVWGVYFMNALTVIKNEFDSISAMRMSFSISLTVSRRMASASSKFSVGS